MNPLKILIIDNYDSFTYNLYDYFLQLNTECTVVRNDEVPFEKIHTFSFDAIVLSPGPKKPVDAGFMMELIAHYHDKVPILGICLGHQGLGEFFGASLQKATLPMHGKTSVIKHQQHSIFKNLPKQYEIMRYHSLLLKELEQTSLVSIAHTSENENMAIAHPNLPLYGVQFHPESILTEHGLQLLDNWLTLVRKDQICLREMLPSEISIVSKMVIDTHNKFNREAVSLEGQKHLVEDIFSTMGLHSRQEKGNYVMVATIANEIIGMAEFRDPGHLKLLFTDQAAHGLGVGTMFIQQARKWVKKNYPEANYLTVSSAPSALEFYLKQGFEATEDLKFNNGISFIPMQLRLDELNPHST